MATLLPNVIALARRRRAAVVCSCPVCRQPVSEGDERVRLRGGLWAHRACGTYQVRYLRGRGSAVTPATRRGPR